MNDAHFLPSKLNAFYFIFLSYALAGTAAVAPKRSSGGKGLRLIRYFEGNTKVSH